MLWPENVLELFLLELHQISKTAKLQFHEYLGISTILTDNDSKNVDVRRDFANASLRSLPHNPCRCCTMVNYQMPLCLCTIRWRLMVNCVCNRHRKETSPTSYTRRIPWCFRWDFNLFFSLPRHVSCRRSFHAISDTAKCVMLNFSRQMLEYFISLTTNHDFELTGRQSCGDTFHSLHTQLHRWHTSSVSALLPTRHVLWRHRR